MMVLFLGIAIFFFFMGIRTNTEINEHRDIKDLDNKTQNTQGFLTFQTYLDRFNILSRTCFSISMIFGILFLLKLLILGLMSI